MTVSALFVAFGGPPHEEQFPRVVADADARAAAPLPLAPATDDALVARVRAGERDAFETLIRRYHVRLVAAAASALGTRHEAEDIVQDVLLGLWMNRARWFPESGAAVYLFGAVANRVRNVWRDRERAQRLQARAAAEQDRVAGDAVNAVRVADDIADIWDAIAKLPERWRTAIVLRFVRDASFADVGAAMGISENAAKKVVRRALEALVQVVGAP